MEKAITHIKESARHQNESTDWFSAIRAEMKETEKKLVEWAIIDLTSKKEVTLG